MANFDFDIEYEVNSPTGSGKSIITFELVARNHELDFVYPLTVKYIDGTVMHDPVKLKQDIPNDQLRISLITGFKSFIKGLVEK